MNYGRALHGATVARRQSNRSEHCVTLPGILHRFPDLTVELRCEQLQRQRVPSRRPVPWRAASSAPGIVSMTADTSDRSALDSSTALRGESVLAAAQLVVEVIEQFTADARRQVELVYEGR